MNKYSCIVIAATVMLMFFSACGVNVGGVSDESETAHTAVVDSMTFDHGHGSVCHVRACVDAEYPSHYKNDSLTRRIQALYVREVLNLPGDSMSVDSALAVTVRAMLAQFGDAEDEIEYGISATGRVQSFSAEKNITISRDGAIPGIMTFCCHDMVNKGDVAAMDSHRYVNVDLNSMTAMDVYDLFDEAAVPEVAELLKAALLEQTNAKSEDDLIGMGYFNLDNITANGNFYFGENGVTWNYVPYEIACFSVGETQITLDYNALAPYISSRSVLYNYVKNYNSR